MNRLIFSSYLLALICCPLSLHAADNDKAMATQSAKSTVTTNSSSSGNKKEMPSGSVKPEKQVKNDEDFFDEEFKEGNATLTNPNQDPNFGRLMPDTPEGEEPIPPMSKMKRPTKSTMPTKRKRIFSKDPIQNFISNLTIGNKVYARETYNRNKQLKAIADEDNEAPDYLNFEAFTLVISDIDPGSDPKVIFNHDENNLYAIRTPGLIINDDIVNGISMAYQRDKIRLIVVLSRNDSRLYRAACTDESDMHPHVLLAKLQHAVELAKKQLPELKCKSPDLIEAIAKHNMFETMRYLLVRLPQFRKHIKDEKESETRTAIIGAIENVESGSVTFYDLSSV